MFMKSKIEFTKRFEKEIIKVPSYIQEAAAAWMDSVEEIGLENTNRLPGYNAEHLKGSRKGQRSVRLNKAYRIIFTVKNGEIQVVCLQEISKHKY